jgi:hypothetical protein
MHRSHLSSKSKKPPVQIWNRVPTLTRPGRISLMLRNLDYKTKDMPELNAFVQELRGEIATLWSEDGTTK